MIKYAALKYWYDSVLNTVSNILINCYTLKLFVIRTGRISTTHFESHLSANMLLSGVFCAGKQEQCHHFCQLLGFRLHHVVCSLSLFQEQRQTSVKEAQEGVTQTEKVRETY